jgi:ABC-type antimicrobial peptide transport system permease subunit
VFSLAYIGRELRRRLGRTILTALGLAMGVGLVIGIIGVSDGLSDAQNHVLAPLQSVGTDILVTRVIGAPTSTGTTGTTATTSTTTSTTTPGRGGFGGRGGAGAGGNACAAGGGGGGFFGAGGGGGGAGGGATANPATATANQADCDALLSENNNVVTDLSKLGKAGTKFTHDFFLSATYLSFPQTAVTDVAKLPGVTTAVPGLVQLVEHETGTVPNIVASVKTGGQTYTQTSRPAPLTTAERQAFISCLATKGVTIGRRGAGGGGGGGGTAGGTTPTTGPGGGGGGGGGFGGGGGGFVFGGGNPAFTDCLPARFQQFQAQFTVPLQTINQVVNPPSTDITNTSYTAAGVDTANPNVGLVTAAQVTSGQWFSKDATSEVLLNVAYATQKSLKVGSALAINGTSYKVVGLVKPTLAGNTFDVYFPLPTIQKLATKQNRVTQILVTASSSGQVDKVAAEIRKQLPGAEVVTSKSLADAVTGSLADAKSLSDRLGGALAVIVLIAAFIIAALLTLSSIGKRVREIGTLRAIGWSKGRVVRQLLGETIGIGIIGGALGLLAGFGVSKAVHMLSPKLKATAAAPPGLTGSSLSSFFGQAATTAKTTTVTLSAPIHGSTLLLGLLFALIGGVVAGLVGSWRAARLAPATALRDLG